MEFKSSTFKIPEDWLTIKTIDMHTAGEPLRVVLEGFPNLKGETVLDFREFLRSRYDHLRKVLIFEPRGHADMYGVVVTPSAVADFGVVFMHNEGYSTMCGHATIAIAKLAVESGWVPQSSPVTHLKIEAPCGIIDAFADVNNGMVESVRFQNVPSYVVALDETVAVPELGKIKYDLAYGGAFYALVNADHLGVKCVPENHQRLIEMGKRIKHAVMNETDKIIHPLEEDLSFLYGTIFVGGPVSQGVDSRNVCIFADGELDRSPTGSGVSARAAVHHKRGELKEGEQMIIESILGTTFECKIVKSVNYHGIDAVIPEVKGNAYITGLNAFAIDPRDPFQEGFLLR